MWRAAGPERPKACVRNAPRTMSPRTMSPRTVSGNIRREHRGHHAPRDIGLAAIATPGALRDRGYDVTGLHHGPGGRIGHQGAQDGVIELVTAADGMIGPDQGCTRQRE